MRSFRLGIRCGWCFFFYLSGLVARRVASVTCSAFRITLLHLECNLFHPQREREEVTVLACSADDLTFIMARNSSDVSKM